MKRPRLSDRPQIKDFMPYATLSEAHKMYIKSPVLWGYIQALDAYIDSLESKAEEQQEQYTEIEKEAQKWLDETDTMQFSQMELLTMFAAHQQVKNNDLLLDKVKEIAFGDGSAQERMVDIKALLAP
jgi:hypothetical protein